LTPPKVAQAAEYPEAEAPPPGGPSGPSPLASARYLTSQLITDMIAVVGHLERRLSEAEVERRLLRERIEEAEVIRSHVIKNVGRLRPEEIDDAFALTGALRADLAALEERVREMSGRLDDAREELEVLRSVHRDLDDLADLDSMSALEGAARFRSASRQVFQIIEEERMRIARDMHDGPAQALANLVLQAEVLERLIERDPQRVIGELADFKVGVRTALEETRRLIFDLRPMTLDDLGLVPTLRRFVQEFGQDTEIQARFHLVGEERRLPGNYEAVLFRIIQEALTNVRKHSRAGSAEVTLTLQPRRVVAVVRDDGEGFDVAATEARQGRTRNLGLISMRERAELEKGSLEIRSEVGRGTEVRVTFTF